MQRGMATMTLDTGQCPRWLFERMVKLGRQMVRILVEEYGAEEFVRRIADPVWFQTLGTVLAFDWNASGLTTILTAALKQALRGEEERLGLFVCGGKGRTSRKTPEEIQNWGNRLALPLTQTQGLVYHSRMAAKVDSALVQDGFQIYHHAFFFARSGAWAVVQQGMNAEAQAARRYHWYSETVEDLVNEPHAGIASQALVPHMLNMTAEKSGQTREISTELAQGSYGAVLRDIEIIRRHNSELSKVLAVRVDGQEYVGAKFENQEFHHHPVEAEDFSKSAYLEKILKRVTSEQPRTYENFLATEGVGPKTVRALALVSEVIYGAAPSYEDPARYSFAHGGKDATPYPVDRATYDQTIRMLSQAVQNTTLPTWEKSKIQRRLADLPAYPLGKT